MMSMDGCFIYFRRLCGSLVLLLLLASVSWSAPRPRRLPPTAKAVRKPAQAAAEPAPTTAPVIATADVADDKLESGDAILELPPVKKPERVTELSLREAIRISLRQNKELRIAQNEYDSSENTYWGSHYSYHFPVLDLSVSGSETKTLGTSALAKEETTSAAVRGTIPLLGLTYKFTPLSQTHSSDSTTDTRTQTKKTELGFSLLKGFGPVIYPKIMEQAELTLERARLTKDDTKVKTVNALRAEYWDLLKATRKLAILRQSAVISRGIVRETEARIRAGVVAPLERNNAVAAYYTTLQSYLDGETTLVQEQKKFKTLLGLEATSAEVWFQPKEDVEVSRLSEPPKDLNKLVAEAIRERPDFVVAQRSLEQARVSKSQASNALLPSLDFTSTTAEVNANTGLTRTQAVGVTLTWTIPNVEASTGYKNAVISEATEQIKMAKLRRGIQDDLIAVVQSLESRYQRIRPAQLSVEFGQKKLEAEQIQYRVGNIAQKQLIETSRDLGTARLSALEATIDYVKGLIELDAALGTARFE